MTALTAVRVDPDGTITDIPLPAEHDHHDTYRQQLGGWPEFAHYGQSHQPVALCAIVHENGLTDGMPANPAATDLADLARGGPLPYQLHGPVLLLGYHHRTGALTDLPDDLRAALRETR